MEPKTLPVIKPKAMAALPSRIGKIVRELKAVKEGTQYKRVGGKLVLEQRLRTEFVRFALDKFSLFDLEALVPRLRKLGFTDDTKVSQDFNRITFTCNTVRGLTAAETEQAERIFNARAERERLKKDKEKAEAAAHKELQKQRDLRHLAKLAARHGITTSLPPEASAPTIPQEAVAARIALRDAIEAAGVQDGTFAVPRCRKTPPSGIAEQGLIRPADMYVCAMACIPLQKKQRDKIVKDCTAALARTSVLDSKYVVVFSDPKPRNPRMLCIFLKGVEHGHTPQTA